MSSASIQETLKQINSTLKASKEGPYANYSCKNVSWDDVQRGTVDGGLSCWGANITDTRLYAKDGRQLFTVRGDNWNERLGKVTSDDIAIVATPDHSSSDSDNNATNSLRPFTLREILSRSSEFGAYAGLKEDTLVDDVLDKEVSVRFQTTFLPVEEGTKSTLEFAPEAYNYNTHSDDDPRNLILLCTSQGLAIQQDGEGSKKLYHHAVDNNGHVKRYWLEAESSNHKVGGAQRESKEEKEDAIKRGKATSSVIGVKGIGTRFNVLMTIQIPLKQKPNNREQDFYLGSPAGCLMVEECDEYEEEECDGEAFCAMEMFSGGMDNESSLDSDDEECYEESRSASISNVQKRMKKCAFGKSSAARVSRGTEVDSWEGLTVENPKRHENEHITATIVMYYTCSGGIPTQEDVKSAIDDLEELYRSVATSGSLSEDEFNFMKSELTVKDMADIEKKLTTQPPPKPPAPIYFDVFPS